MKNIFLILAIFLFILSDKCFSQEEVNIFKEVFTSPKGKYQIKFIGNIRGEGAYYLDTQLGLKEILKRDFRYGPSVIWINEYLAELKFPSGSPNYNSYFYDCKNCTLSPEFILPIAVDTVNYIVVCLDYGILNFYKLFSEKLIMKYSIKNLEPMGLLVFCNWEAKFNNDGNLIFSIDCPAVKNTPFQEAINNKYFISVPK